MVSPTTRANLVVFSVAVGVSLLAGEAMLRAVIDLPLTRRMPEIRYDHHPVRRFTLRPGQSGYTYGAPATVDERGFRVNGLEQEHHTGSTIFALGDSFTFGMGVRDEETWPARLEALLRQQGQPSVRVINGGTISYGVFQEMDLLKSSGLSTHPRLLVHALYWNDFMNAAPPPSSTPSVVTPEGYLARDRIGETRNWLANAASMAVSRSALLFAARQATRQILSNGRSGDSAYGRAYAEFLERGLTDDDWIPLEQFYKDLRALAESNNMATMVIIMPVNDIVRRPGAEAHAYPTAARRRLDALGIPYVDAFTLWSKAGYGGRHFLTQGSDAHLDAAGYRIVAEATAKSLLRAGMLDALGHASAR